MHLSVDLWGRDEVRDMGLWDGWKRVVALIDEGLNSSEYCTEAVSERMEAV